MKHRLKQITKFIAICALVILSSCEKDLYEENIITNSKIVVKNISLKDAFAKNNYKLMKAVDKLKEKQKDIAARMVYDSTYNFYYDDENGKYMEYNDMISFTFPIIKENNDDELKNIVFSLNNNNEFEIYLTKYNLTEEEKVKLSNDETFIPQNEIEIDELYKPTGDPCYRIVSIPVAWNEQGQVTESYFYLEEIACPGTGGGGTQDNTSNGGSNPLYGNGGYPGGTPGGTTVNTSGTNSNTGPNGGGGGIGTTPIITTPVPCVICPSQVEEVDACTSMNKLLIPSRQVLSAINSVNTAANGFNGEQGAFLNNNNSNYDSTILQPSTNNNGISYSMSLSTMTPVVYGIIHSHPVDAGNPPAAPMFSFDDLNSLVLLYRKTDPINRPDVVIMLVIPDGSVYALKIDDYLKFITYVNNYNNYLDVQRANTTRDKLDVKNGIFDRAIRNGAQEGGNYNEEKYVRGFIDEMKNKGVSLFKLVDNKTKWEKIESPERSSDLPIRNKCN